MRYRCSALPIKVTSQPGAGRWFGLLYIRERMMNYLKEDHRIYITAIFFLQKILHSTVHIYDFHIFIICNDSVSFSLLFSFFFVQDQIASFQLKQFVVFLKCSVYVFKIIPLSDCDRVWLLNYNRFGQSTAYSWQTLNMNYSQRVKQFCIM